MAYRQPAAPAAAESIVRGSRFVARAEPASTRAEATAAIASVRAAHPKARHCCWAYLLGAPDTGEGGSSDDGEPSGTAGRPIQGVVRHHEIGDLVVTVSRYFGGIRLGAGGLARAYAHVAEMAVGELAVTWVVPQCEAVLDMGFAQEHGVRGWAARHGAAIEGVDYGEGVALRLRLPASERAALEAFCAAEGIVCAFD